MREQYLRSIIEQGLIPYYDGRGISQSNKYKLMENLNTNTKINRLIQIS